jgi:two-component system, NarL family, sensor kinase
MNNISLQAKVLLSLVGILVFQFSWAQTRNELIAGLSKEPEDTSKVFTYIGIAQQYENDFPDSALYYYEKSRQLSEQLNYTFGTIKYINNVTFVLNQLAKFDSGLQLNLKSVELARKINHRERLSACLGNTAASYQSLFEYEKAADYYAEALKIADELDLYGHRMNITSNLCAMYHELNLFDKSLYYGEMGLEIARKSGNVNDKVASLTNTGAILVKLKQFEKAEAYYQEALSISKASSLHYEMALSYDGLADLYITTHKYEPLRGLYDQQQMAAQKGGLVRLGIRADIGLGIAAYYGQQHEAAAIHLSKGIKSAEENKFQDILLSGYHYASYNEAALGNPKKAVVYQEKLDSIQSLHFDEQTKKAVQELEAKYKTAQQDKLIATQQFDLKKRSLYNWLLALGLAAASLIALLVWRNAKKSKQLQQQQLRAAATHAEMQLYQSKIDTQNTERKRIAAELHDDIGASLSSLHIYSSLAEQSINTNTAKAAEMLRKIGQQSKAVMENMSDIVWSMTNDFSAGTSIENKIKNFAAELLVNGNIDFKCSIASNADQLLTGITARRNLYLIAKEAMNNIVKYSKAKIVNLSLQVEEQQLVLAIMDDGIGFNPAAITRGNGLGNMQQRSRELNGVFEIAAGVDGGTMIRATFPLEAIT